MSAPRPDDQFPGQHRPPASPLLEGEGERIVGEEQACLSRVLQHLSQRQKSAPRDTSDYDARLLDLRDQIAQARMEDVPPLVQEMERVQSLALRLRDKTEIPIDAGSPYFGRLVLEENGREREVLIGRGTHLDTSSGIRIVDWRDAPVSRLFYRHEEGDDYDEVFGEREVSGWVRVRRSLQIREGVLRRVTAPQGSFARADNGDWRTLATTATHLAGGAGTALRAEGHHRPGRLGTELLLEDDKLLREITALIDRRQFELITAPDSGLVVIQGGAGSGKTTIGLHRLAYLAFRDARRFQPSKMLVIVFNDALARYISGVLPALGVHGVAIRTYESWAERVRQGMFPRLPRRYHEDTPGVVTRMKKHPAMLLAIDAQVSRLEERIASDLSRALELLPEPLAQKLRGILERSRGRALAHSLFALRAELERSRDPALGAGAKNALERVLSRGIAEARDVVSQWAELVTDLGLLREHLLREGGLSAAELGRAHGWCTAQVHEVLEERAELEEELASSSRHKPQRRDQDEDTEGATGERDGDGEARRGVDGERLAERARLDREDDALLLGLSQRLRGPLTRGKNGNEPILYEHILVDEAQDLSPVELSVVLGAVSPGQSLTLAGDIQQRLLLDNGFSDWPTVLGELGLSHVAVEPLRVSYRSTKEIVDLARDVLGPLAHADAPEATRSGAPVEMFRFTHTGEAVAFLAEALRELSSSEPNASVAVVSRFPEQADAYHDGLQRGEVPRLRRIREQEFSFKPGIDVTDVRQVKGLEFDYVILVEVSATSYPEDDESRHLLHIGATRAAHQLWLVSAGAPSPVLPNTLLERSP